jgi:hypothetical protein
MDAMRPRRRQNQGCRGEDRDMEERGWGRDRDRRRAVSPFVDRMLERRSGTGSGRVTGAAI